MSLHENEVFNETALEAEQERQASIAKFHQDQTKTLLEIMGVKPAETDNDAYDDYRNGEIDALKTNR